MGSEWKRKVVAARLSEAAPLRLLQPESHVHLAVHRRSGRKVFAGFLMGAHTSIELAEAEVAVGNHRAHVNFLGDGHGLPVRGFGLVGMRWVAMRSDLAESPESPRLVRAWLVVTRKVE